MAILSGVTIRKMRMGRPSGDPIAEKSKAAIAAAVKADMLLHSSDESGSVLVGKTWYYWRKDV